MICRCKYYGSTKKAKLVHLLMVISIFSKGSYGFFKGSAITRLCEVSAVHTYLVEAKTNY